MLMSMISLMSGSFLVISGDNLRGTSMPSLELGFLIVSSLNLMGLVPGSMSLLSSPLALGSFMVWSGYVLSLVVMDWEYLVSSFVPNCPLMLVPLLFVIEVISYLVRPIALMLRIMVNLMCGHLLLVVGGMMVMSGSWMPIVLVLLLELSVAVVQSFVMFLLLSM